MPAVLTIGIEAAYESSKTEPLTGIPDTRAEVADKVISRIYAMIEARTMEESMRRMMDVLADHYKAGHVLIYLQKENGFGYECACRRDERDGPLPAAAWKAISRNGWTRTTRAGSGT